MSTGSSAIHRTPTADTAATIIQQAITLAKKRGHSQLTPLHVASVLLASPTCLFRTVCLQIHSHPLQWKALELCLNVALNRLPSIPVLGLLPSVSKSLVAAFKKAAQGYQDHGCLELENRLQQVVHSKIELEELVVCILDDLSVGRVMREAGYSSTQVKIKFKQAVLSAAETSFESKK